MNETQRVFPGYASYLEAAAREGGLEAAVAPSRANRVLANLGNLCSQATTDDPARIAAILGGVEALAAQLRLAAMAGERMAAELRSRLGGPEADAPPAPGAPPARDGRPRGGARAARRPADG
jgi:hypothetical protein